MCTFNGTNRTRILIAILALLGSVSAYAQELPAKKVFEIKNHCCMAHGRESYMALIDSSYHLYWRFDGSRYTGGVDTCRVRSISTLPPPSTMADIEVDIQMPPVFQSCVDAGLTKEKGKLLEEQKKQQASDYMDSYYTLVAHQAKELKRAQADLANAEGRLMGIQQERRETYDEQAKTKLLPALVQAVGEVVQANARLARVYAVYEARARKLKESMPEAANAADADASGVYVGYSDSERNQLAESIANSAE